MAENHGDMYNIGITNWTETHSPEGPGSEYSSWFLVYSLKVKWYIMS